MQYNQFWGLYSNSPYETIFNTEYRFDVPYRVNIPAYIEFSNKYKFEIADIDTSIPPTIELGVEFEDESLVINLIIKVIDKETGKPCKVERIEHERYRQNVLVKEGKTYHSFELPPEIDNPIIEITECIADIDNDVLRLRIEKKNKDIFKLNEEIALLESLSTDNGAPMDKNN